MAWLTTEQIQQIFEEQASAKLFRFQKRSSDVEKYFNSEAISRHCELLGIDFNQAYFRAISWDGGRAIDLPPTDGDRTEELKQLQADGYRLYLVTGGARNDADVKSIPAVWAEWDGISVDETLELLKKLQSEGLPAPTLLLTTWEEGSVHAWWRLETPSTDIAAFTPFMKRFVAALGSDPTCVNPSRLMRLAGSVYIAKSSHPKKGQVLGVAEIIHEEPDAVTSLEALQTWVEGEFEGRPELSQYLQAAGDASVDPSPESERKGPARPMEQITAALKAIPQRESGLPERNLWRYSKYRGVLCGLRDALYRLHLASGMTEEEARDRAHEDAIEMMEEHSPSADCGWNVPQVLSSSFWLSEGNFWKAAKEAGYDPPKCEVADNLYTDEDREFTHQHLRDLRKSIGSKLNLYDILPAMLAEEINNHAEALDVDPIAFLQPLLSTCGSIVGTRVDAYVKKDWVEPLVIWAGNVLPPSAMKSPISDSIIKPLRGLEAELREEYEAELRALQTGAPEDEQPDPPPPRRLIVDDCTYERVGELLSEPNTCGLLSDRDELASFFAQMEKSHQGTARQGYLQMWSGRGIIVDRKQSASCFAPKTSFGIFGNIQPDKLAQLIQGDSAQSVEGGDGLWARFLWCRPEARVWRWTEKESELTHLLGRIYRQLDTIYANSLLRLSPAAKGIMMPWLERLAEESANSNAARAAFMGKLRGYCVRIAGILELLHLACLCIRNGDEGVGGMYFNFVEGSIDNAGETFGYEIGDLTAEMALKVVSFYLDQFDAIQSEVFDGGSVPSWMARVLRKVQERKLTSVSPRDLQAWRVNPSWKTAKDCLEGLRQLESMGCGKVVQGPRSDSYRWIPEANC